MPEYGELLRIRIEEGNSFISSYPYILIMVNADGVNFITGNTVRVVRIVAEVAQDHLFHIDDAEAVQYMSYIQITLSVVSGCPVSSGQSFDIVPVVIGKCLFSGIIVLYAHVVMGNPYSTVRSWGQIRYVIADQFVSIFCL